MRLLPALIVLLAACRSEDKDPIDSLLPQDDSAGEVDNDGDGSVAGLDCDDNNAALFPENAETPYNGFDDDCDPATPDDDLDADGVTQDQDCDDQDPAVYPGATEACNGLDDDCNGETDDSVGSLFYPDKDADGYGAAEGGELSCEGNAGYVADNTDCDDLSGKVNPGAEEACDELDNDCDGETDEGVLNTYYQDSDGDSFGDPDLPVEACTQPTGYANNEQDCDDSRAKVNPNGVERCDGLDNDCDGSTDGADSLDADTWYTDADADGYGDPDSSALSCSQPSGMVDNDEDCDDTDASLNPETVWYLDYDGDGFGGDDITIQSCTQPKYYEDNNADCDDSSASAYPGGSEVCNGEDDDCDGLTDDEDTVSGTSTWYADSDKDGYGDLGVTTKACDAPSGYGADSSDCDDGDSSVNPGATETCDETDQDCDGDLGLSQCEDCAAILAADSSSTDGVYTIDIDGSGGQASFEVYCDMSTDGGGWTRWWWYEAGAGLSGVTDVLADDLWDCDPSSDTKCLSTMPITNPSELLVTNNQSNWAVWNFDSSNTTSNNVLKAFTKRTVVAYSTSAACTGAWNPVAQYGTLTDNPYKCDENNNDNSGCRCFWYASYNGVYSFYLDDDTGWAETAFGAGYDNSGTLGVDSLETAYRYASTSSYSLWMYYR